MVTKPASAGFCCLQEKRPPRIRRQGARCCLSRCPAMRGSCRAGRHPRTASTSSMRSSTNPPGWRPFRRNRSSAPRAAPVASAGPIRPAVDRTGVAGRRRSAADRWTGRPPAVPGGFHIAGLTAAITRLDEGLGDQHAHAGHVFHHQHVLMAGQTRRIFGRRAGCQARFAVGGWQQQGHVRTDAQGAANVRVAARLQGETVDARQSQAGAAA